MSHSHRFMGKNLEELMHQAGVSKRHLATRSGVSIRTIQRLLCNQTGTMRTKTEDRLQDFFDSVFKREVDDKDLLHEANVRLEGLVRRQQQEIKSKDAALEAKEQIIRSTLIELRLTKAAYRQLSRIVQGCIVASRIASLKGIRVRSLEDLRSRKQAKLAAAA